MNTTSKTPAFSTAKACSLCGDCCGSHSSTAGQRGQRARGRCALGLEGFYQEQGNLLGLRMAAAVLDCLFPASFGTNDHFRELLQCQVNFLSGNSVRAYKLVNGLFSAMLRGSSHVANTDAELLLTFVHRSKKVASRELVDHCLL